MNTERIRVYKFGGASVKDAAAFRNLSRIIQHQDDGSRLLVVVSAMGKTTNALEALLGLAFRQQDFSAELEQLKAYHVQVLQELFSKQDHPAHERLEHLFDLLRTRLSEISPTDNFDWVYDQTVSFGELFSATILHYFLAEQDVYNSLIDSRKYIQTDNNWREGKVDWAWTERLVRRDVPQLLQQGLVVTQGFLGGTNNGHTTTLGREGSDFSAAIFAFCLDASEMVIWKDVAGLLNADPKHFPDTVRYPEISYQETVEMAYYGASVIHPKTIKPLANKKIPLYVKSFLDPEGEGTKICDCRFEVQAPAYIIKENQCLVSFGVKDFTFISEKNLGTIFNALSELRIKINLMQNSAISFSICTDYNPERLERLMQTLQDQFVIHYNTQLQLYTVKNYNAESIKRIQEGKEVLLEQRTRTTFQIVCR
ncbi:aspartate kinase [Pontibacter chinhatensis]|uniref:Aspartokinase n=1 Tax=Pontibacter chinhatensis TaxID=1436961 RepID=A0A1I2YY17_9BACT|nr:aspartate kinase [Pontibacter chinhatensis]SFH30169.1 aspartate kinase [Pontibacter chinhatensis]